MELVWVINVIVYSISVYLFTDFILGDYNEKCFFPNIIVNIRFSSAYFDHLSALKDLRIVVYFFLMFV